MGNTPKSDALRAMREAKFTRRPKRSSGGVEGHAGLTPVTAQSATLKRPAYPGVESTDGRRGEQGAGIKPGPLETTPKRKPGRPRIEDKDSTIEAQKPWVTAGMSRRSWYARQKAAK